MPRRLVYGLDGAALRETTVDVGDPRSVDPDAFASLSRNCPYGGMRFRCWPAGDVERENVVMGY